MESPDKLAVVARIDALRSGVPVSATVANTELVVLRVGDEVSVFQGTCPHQGTSLVGATVTGTSLECPSHRWCFDTRTGERLDRPGDCLRRFDAVVEQGEVRVDVCEIGQWTAKSVRKSPHAPRGRPGVRSIASLPGPKPLPLVGNVLSLRATKFHAAVNAWGAEYGSAFKLSLPGAGVAVALCNPNTIRGVFRDRPGGFSRIGSLAPLLQEIGGHGLFSQEGDAWRRTRRLTMPAFNMGQLRSFHGTMNNILRRLLGRWERAAASGRPVHVQDEMTRFTVDITTSLAFGHDLNTIEDKAGDIRDHLGVLLPRISQRLLAPFPYWRYVRLPGDRAFDRARGAIRALVSELVAQARASTKGKDPADATTFLESLVMATDDAGARLTDTEIYANVLTMLVAGEDTTAHTLAWVVHFMTEHPSVQEQMAQEADSVLGGPFAQSLSDYDRLPLIGAVAAESMRLRPVAPVIFLQALQDAEVENIAIPKGTTVLLLPRQAGLSDAHFADAHVFDPQRWLDGRGGAHHPQALFPFGYGPRHCPGRNLAMTEVASVLAMLASQFSATKVPGHPEVEERFGFVATATPIHVKLRRRS